MPKDRPPRCVPRAGTSPCRRGSRPFIPPGVRATVIHFAGGGNRTRRASEVPTVSSKRNQNSATKTFRTLLKNAECTVQQIFTGEPCATCTPRDAPGPRPPRRALARGATLLAAVPRSFCLTQCVWFIPGLVFYRAPHTAVSLLPLMDMSSDSVSAVRASSCLCAHARGSVKCASRDGNTGS